jgi:murein L,D-transpeptidase YafK
MKALSNLLFLNDFSKQKRLLLGAGLCALMAVSAAAPAAAFRIELKDVAPDRIERQRAEAIGLLPLPGTPNVAQLEQRLKDKGLAAGSAIYIRVFKAESELEIWMQKGDRYELFATYPICHWSGTLGPKVAEGDKQTPEGIYTVTSRQVHASGRHPKALNLGFPNALDRQFQRTGSYILIHGGCGSVGCFAMTNPVIDEVFTLSQAALKNGQDVLHVHAFPFRLTEDRLRAYAMNEWYDFWRNLKDVYDAFERTKRPPRVSVCEGRYWIDTLPETDGSREVASQGPLAVCGAPQVVASLNSPTESASSLSAPLWSQPPRAQQVPLLDLPTRGQPPQVRNRSLPTRRAATALPLQRAAQPLVQSQIDLLRSQRIPTPCSTSLPNCRKWLSLQARIVEAKLATNARQAAATPRASQRRP